MDLKEIEADKGEATTGNISDADRNARVIFKKSDWLYKISPRFGISHVISDGATFTFNYGLIIRHQFMNIFIEM